MKHAHLTDQQIREALLKAGYKHLWRVAELRAVLDALPDPVPVADEWEECGPDELRKGDRYLVKGDGWPYEGVVSYSYSNILCTHPATGARLTKAMVKHRRSGLHLFRIPAPVQHPDPEEHPLITVHKFDGDEMPEGTYARATKNLVGAIVYEVVYGDDPTAQCIANGLAIDDWSPAQIVPAGDA